MAEEEIARINSERIKVLSQLFCNNEAMERVKAESKRIKSLESKEEMKPLDGVSESESESESDSESDTDSESESESLDPLKVALKRLKAESKRLKQERDRLKSIYQHLKSIKKINPSHATFKRTGNKIMPRSVNKVSTPMITLEDTVVRIADTVADLTLQDDNADASVSDWSL